MCVWQKLLQHASRACWAVCAWQKLLQHVISDCWRVKFGYVTKAIFWRRLGERTARYASMQDRSMKDKIHTSFIINVTFCLAVQMNGQDRNALVHLAPVAALLLGLISDYQQCSGFRVTKPSLPRKQQSVYVCTLCVQSENLWRIQSFERCHSCRHSFINVHVVSCSVICTVVHLGSTLPLRVNCASLHWLCYFCLQLLFLRLLCTCIQYMMIVPLPWLCIFFRDQREAYGNVQRAVEDVSVRIINWDILVKNIRAYYLVSTISFRLSLSLSVALSCCLALFSQLNTASTPSTTVSVLLYTFRKLLSTMVLSVVCKLQSQFSNHIAPLLTTKLVHKESAVVVLCYYIKPVQ